MSILVLQSSWWGRESWLLCLICLPGVSWWLSGSSSRCHGVVCSLWLWYFLIILTIFDEQLNFRSQLCGAWKKFFSTTWPGPLIIILLNPLRSLESSIKFRAQLSWVRKKFYNLGPGERFRTFRSSSLFLVNVFCRYQYGGYVPEFLRKPIATCDFPGGRWSEPLPPSGSAHVTVS